jgi:recombination endonuclease VII
MKMPRSNDGRWTATCEVCKREYQQKRPNQRACSALCRNKIPRNTGGRRARADLEPRTCQNPECGKVYQPVRDSQISCSRPCLLKCPSYIEAQRRTDNRPERRARQNELRNLATTPDVERRRFINLRNNMRKAGVDVTWEIYQGWLARQDGFCKICGIPAGDKNGHTDHDHQTKVLRDLLCYSCNNGLGMFQDDPVLLRAAADYIERHRALALSAS